MCKNTAWTTNYNLDLKILFLIDCLYYCYIFFLVDWATLAQQWIQMKETFPVGQVPPAPPPPNIKADIEAGEAPMDMSKDETPPIPATRSSQGRLYKIDRNLLAYVYCIVYKMKSFD